MEKPYGHNKAADHAQLYKLPPQAVGESAVDFRIRIAKTLAAQAKACQEAKDFSAARILFIIANESLENIKRDDPWRGVDFAGGYGEDYIQHAAAIAEYQLEELRRQEKCAQEKLKRRAARAKTLQKIKNWFGGVFGLKGQ